MNQPSSLLKRQISLIVILAISLVWVAATYELYRSRETHLHEAEVRTLVQAHVFAEYSRSTFKRINEFILDVRNEWDGDWKSFSNVVQRRQENIDDLTFQVAVIDRDGILAYSNLALPNDRIDLSQREHFRIHKEAGNADRLFISKPLLGKVSGKWSIQLTRAIFRSGQFNGVLVVSISPEQFAGFAAKLGLKGESVLTVVRNTGEIMARYPAVDSSVGKILRNVPYLDANEPDSGNFRVTAAVDAKERIYGYFRLPEYQLSFVQGDSISDILVPHHLHRTTVLTGAVAITLIILMFFVMLVRSLSSLEEVRQQLAVIFSLSPDGFLSFDKQRRVSYVSPAFSRMTGLDKGDIAGLDEDAFTEKLRRLSVAGKPFNGLEAMRAAQAAGSVNHADRFPRHQFELAGAGNRVLEVDIRMADAEAVSQILYFRDITHETEVDRLKSEFLSTAAHELRTPMANIYGFAELMMQPDFPAEEVGESLAIIHRQSELMISIINELLDLVRIEQRQGKDFNISRIDAGELLLEVSSNFKANEGEHTRQQIFNPQQFWIRGDRKKLMQAVNNVLSNAYKYSPGCGDQVLVGLIDANEGSPDGLLGIRISDRGIGMTPDQVSRVFERFYRADTSGKIPGTGLGMSIVREIIELHGGRVDIVSKSGEGTTVTLWIPKG
ncbi:ATP-binding protein [Dechloromonas sp. HYN0024]|uniref:ATP-binding protein n=1 Tax=Dechloromonas sp. HYN0024 TaxID=2231055 RepID=UPI000E452853|nr:ATP-binding protein [Dechloromonas sp. HYN0024]AXS80412.1 hypothetical protein HYN24_10505 [Dechloromonas sp. HYN0024]